ncbi:MAG: Na+/H+ antiporter subunit D [Bacteroidales bacterium]|nr:Na+/H+ antiporter subunit D [Bacteroidales bacterium]MCF8327454.1 Na+/H+ antiporter subunit D [Bacteroidales bacterium]
MHVFIIAPVLFPLLMGLLTLASWRRKKTQEIVNLSGAFIQMLISFGILYLVLTKGIQVIQIGGWEAPFGISFVGDTLSSIMIVLSGIINFSVALYSISYMLKRKMGEDMLKGQFQFAYYPLLNIMFMGINGAFLTGDLFNMYVWFEVMLISSFVLLSLGGSKLQIEGTFKYVTINLVSSAFFLIGVGLLYSMTGTLNMAHLADVIPTIENQKMLTVVSLMFLICFGMKAAIFPLFFWLPASYHTPPISIAAVFAGMLTKVGIYSLLRVFTLMFIGNVAFTHTIILWIAGFTMVVGSLGAISQSDIRRILSFCLISQIGYMIFGLAVFTPLAIAGSVFYIMHHIIVKTNLFLVSGIIHKIKGSYNIKKLGGILNAYPFLSVLFLIPALSVAGIPPLSGFWSKLFVIKAALEQHYYLISIIALAVGLLTLFYMMKIWNEAFWKDDPEPNKKSDKMPWQNLFSRDFIFMIIPVVLLSGITVVIGIFPEPFFNIAERSAHELMNPEIYIKAVLGSTMN